jgi:hypothetical protein
MVTFDFANEAAVGVCQPACQTGDCQDENCNTFTGLCGDTSTGLGKTGDPCQVHEECRGLCMNFWTNGYCSGPCDPNDPACPPGSSCMNLGIHQSCGADCQTDQDCRASDGYFCEPNQKVCVHP